MLSSCSLKSSHGFEENIKSCIHKFIPFTGVFEGSFEGRKKLEGA